MRDLIGQRLEAFEREREVRPALVSRDRVDLVEDHRVDGAQEVAPAGARDEQVQRLGRGDHEGGWAPQHGRALGAGCVAGAHRHPQLRRVESELLGDGRDLGERAFEVLGDVDRQCLEW